MKAEPNAPNNNQKLLNYNEILSTKNIEAIKILGLLIIEDSIANDEISKFYQNLKSIFSDKKTDYRSKVIATALQLDSQRNYIDSCFEICLNSIYSILISSNVNDEIKHNYISYFLNHFEFIYKNKNIAGRIYFKEERLLKTLSKFYQIIAENNDQSKEILNLKIAIFKKFQEYLRYHYSRSKKLFTEYVIFDQENQCFTINSENYTKNLENLKNLIGSDPVKFQDKITTILNNDRIIFKNRCETIIVLSILLEYQDAVAIILGMIDYFNWNIEEIELSDEIKTKIKNYRDLFKKDLLSIPQAIDTASFVKKKTGIFYDKAKSDLDSSIDQLNTSANLLKSS